MPPLKRTIEREIESYDLVVIGGGISGATVFYDACLRGLKTLLIEKSDFASGTSQATSRLIHGGLRYLKNFELGLVRESLKERKILARIAPHALAPRSFFWAHYNGTKPPSFIMKAGLFLYDLLAFDRNQKINVDNRLPGFKSLNKIEAIAFEEGSLKAGMKNAVYYYDYVNHSPERLCYEFIYAGKKNGGIALNYSTVTHLSLQKEMYQIEVMNSHNKRKSIIQSKTIVNASGPWADLVNKLIQKKSEHNIIRSMGIHIVTRKIAGNSAIVLLRPDGSHLFILPLNGRSLIGTTDKIYKGQPDDFYVKKEDILTLIRDTNQTYLGANLELSDVDYHYGGLRPLVEKDSSASTYDASRKIEIEDHKKDDLPGFFTVLGGKYTTSRLLAQKVVDKVIVQLKKEYDECITASIPLPGGDFDSFHELYSKLKKTNKKLAPLKVWSLAKRYGSMAQIILKQKNVQMVSPFKIANGEFYYPEEITWICNNEDILHLEDLIFRRTTIGIHGLMEEGELKRLVTYVGKIKRWNSKTIAREIKSLKNNYVIKK